MSPACNKPGNHGFEPSQQRTAQKKKLACFQFHQLTADISPTFSSRPATPQVTVMPDYAWEFLHDSWPIKVQYPAAMLTGTAVWGPNWAAVPTS